MRKSVIIFWAFLISVCIYRIIFYGIIIEDNSNNCLGKKIFGIGIVVNEPEQKESSQIVVVEVKKIQELESGEVCQSISKIRLKTKLYPRYYYNDNISFSGKLLKPNNFGMDSFDYVGYLAKDDIYFEIKSSIINISYDSHELDKDKHFSLNIIYKSFINKLFLFKESLKIF